MKEKKFCLTLISSLIFVVMASFCAPTYSVTHKESNSKSSKSLSHSGKKTTHKAKKKISKKKSSSVAASKKTNKIKPITSPALVRSTLAHCKDQAVFNYSLGCTAISSKNVANFVELKSTSGAPFKLTPLETHPDKSAQIALTHIVLTPKIKKLFIQQKYTVENKALSPSNSNVDHSTRASKETAVNKAADFREDKQPKQAHSNKEFIKIMLPAVKSINEDILEERKKLLSLEEKYKKQKNLLESEKEWLKELAQNYRIQTVDFSKTTTWTTLKQRVDAIPPSLAIAQAANESDWGKSRFAQQANNYFGQYCYVKGCGIAPKDNTKGDGARQAKRFSDIQEAVRSYINNLNSHKAYEDLRKIRYEQRQKNNLPKGTHLAKGLTPYSIRGKVYVMRITNIIKNFNLEEFDNSVI